MRVACSGDTPSTRIGGIKKCADPGGNAGTDATALIIISDVEINLDRLPDDPALLQQMLRDAVTTAAYQQGELHAENDKLRMLIKRLLRHRFLAAAPSSWEPISCSSGWKICWSKLVAANQSRPGGCRCRCKRR